MKLRVVRSILVVLVAAVATACMGVNDQRPAEYAKLRTRAAFDMRCKEEQLQITPLDEIDTSIAKAAKSAGVTCGDQRATYIFDGPHDVWVLNTDSHPVQAGDAVKP